MSNKPLEYEYLTPFGKALYNVVEQMCMTGEKFEKPLDMDTTQQWSIVSADLPVLTLYCEDTGEETSCLFDEVVAYTPHARPGSTTLGGSGVESLCRHIFEHNTASLLPVILGVVAHDLRAADRARQVQGFLHDNVEARTANQRRLTGLLDFEATGLMAAHTPTGAEGRPRVSVVWQNRGGLVKFKFERILSPKIPGIDPSRLGAWRLFEATLNVFDYSPEGLRDMLVQVIQEGARVLFGNGAQNT